MDVDDIELQRQELLEQEMINSGVIRYKRGIENAKAHINANGYKTPSAESNTSYGVSMLQTYVQDVALQLSKDIEKFRGRPGRKPIAYKYLSKLDPETCAFIGVKSILDNISGITALVTLVNRIGSKIEDNTRLDIFKLQDSKYYKATIRYMNEKQQATTYQKKRKVMIHGAARREDIIRGWEDWGVTVRMHIGNAILEAFIKVTSDYNEEGHRITGSGMIEKSMIKQGKKTKYIIQGTNKAAEWIKANQDVCQYFTPEFLPCLIPPVNWTSPTNGGYHTRALQKRKPLVKMQQRKYLKNMARNGVDSCKPFYDTVNILQQTPWEINTFVYNQMQKEFSGIHGIGMPSQEPLPPPESPFFFMEQGDLSEKQWKIARRDASKKWTRYQKHKYMEWTIKIQKYKRAENDRISHILEVSRTMNAAKRFSFEDEFYYVWTADFRSRLYACGTALNPQGTDKSKALIKFHNGVELGKEGFYHLCIHAAGVYGNDKIELKDRVAWVYDNKEAFIATYNNPDDTKDFWGQADKPYSFLAVCEEIGECIQLDTRSQESFTSYIPCAQDGSCNGIQHYSAMLRDVTGAWAVNLIDSVVPADIYIECANKVIASLYYSINNKLTFNGKDWVSMSGCEMDVAKGWLKFGIVRDCTKKPTMVIPYGGTKIGCRDSCRDYLDKYTKKKKVVDITYTNPFIDIEYYTQDGDKSDSEIGAITWLHHLVWKALDEVVIAARKAMKFLRAITKCAMGKNKDGRPIKWTTPTGFVVYQDIKMTELYCVESHLEGRIQLKLQRDIDRINKRKMQTSIAPNFVHSLDSSHLQLTITLAREMGIHDFACIHDSFGTHAGNCTLLHKAIRHTFYDMYRENVLVNFWYEQLRNNPEILNDLPTLDSVKAGELDLSCVLTSTYFFR